MCFPLYFGKTPSEVTTRNSRRITRRSRADSQRARIRETRAHLEHVRRQTFQENTYRNPHATSGPSWTFVGVVSIPRFCQEIRQLSSAVGHVQLLAVDGLLTCLCFAKQNQCGLLGNNAGMREQNDNCRSGWD